jgi:ribosomal protein L15E
MSFVLIGFQFKELETLNCEWVFRRKLNDGLNKVFKKIFVKKNHKCPP